MEVSSHALALHRADAIHWAVAVFTNLTQDHLDFHPTMEDYFLAKRRLFEAGPRGARSSTSTTPTARAWPRDFPDAITHRPRRARRAGARDRRRGRRERLDASPSTGWRCARRCPGRFNVLNALGAVAVARALGVDDAAIAAALPRAGRVPGRFEPVDEGQAFAVLVDYAHTPDSLENVLRAARELTRRAA